MGYSNDFHANIAFSKGDKVRKPPKHDAASSEFVRFTNALDRAVKRTFRQAVGYVCGTIPLPLQLLPKPRDEFEPTCSSPLESGAKPAARILPRY